jgi:ATP-dependent helicase/nuclease subunit A
VRAAYPALAARDVAALVAEAEAVAALPELAAGTLRREVDVVGDILWKGEVRRVAGRLDRLQVDGRTALVVDYKTDRVVPRSPAAVPDGYRRQLAIYRALVAATLPGHQVSAAIVWTAKPLFMRLDGALPAVSLAPGSA